MTVDSSTIGGGRWGRRLALAALLAFVSAGAACGDDEDGGGGGGGAKKPPPKKAAKKPKGGAKKEAISFIPTLESVVPDAERAKIRRRLRDRDFVPDPTGTENRDPFRSYVLPQIAAPGLGTAGTTLVQPTEQCKKTQLVATSYGWRDLRILGIVQRGPRRYALFRDTKGVGHIVERGSCLGREKAIVTEIGEGHVTIEISPSLVPGAAPAPPEKVSIPLYPNELTVENLDQTDDDDAMPSSVAPPPSVAPAPAPTF